MLTAHLDHTGVRPSGDGDRINNGAYDNATGSAIVLEVARALAGQPVRPKRSVVVVLVTAEEKGLLGSDYFAHYPVKAAGRMVANVNLDMPVFMAASRDIVAFGSENSTLDAVVRKAVAEFGYTLSPDPMPEENIFVRSDQYSLVKQRGAGGVPDAGIHREGPGREWAAGVRRLPGVALPQAERRLVAARWICRRWSDSPAPTLPSRRAIADDPVDPTWKPGNFFGKMFGNELTRTRLRDRDGAADDRPTGTAGGTPGGYAPCTSRPPWRRKRALLRDAERVLRARLVGLPWTQHHRREIRFVRRVRIVLRLQAQAAALDVGLAAAALDRSVQEVARVELHPGLGGGDVHDPAADRIGDARAHAHGPRRLPNTKLWS